MSPSSHPFSTLLAEEVIPGFLRDNFGQRPRHFVAGETSPPDFDLRAFFEILRDTDWGTDDKLEIFDGETHRRSAKLRSEMVGQAGNLSLDSMLIAKKRKCSFYLRELQLRHQALREMHRGLRLTGEFDGNINAFFTPAHARAAPDHYDFHDLFAIQIAGEKLWHVAAGPDLPNVVSHKAFAFPDDYEVKVDRSVRLVPGDVLYLPRGTGHYAEALDSDSLHLVLGLRPLMWENVLREIVDRVMAEDAAVRASAVDGGGAPGEVGDAVVDRVASHFTPEALAEARSKIIRERAQRALSVEHGQMFARSIDALL